MEARNHGFLRVFLKVGYLDVFGSVVQVNVFFPVKKAEDQDAQQDSPMVIFGAANLLLNIWD